MPQTLECNSAVDVVNSFEDLAQSITSFRFLDKWVQKDKINQLGASTADKSKEHIDLITAANAYYNLTEQLLGSEAEKLKKMFDNIKSDIDILLYTEGKQAIINGDKLRESCVKIDRAEAKLREFSSSVDKCKEHFKETITPQLSKITKGMDDFIVKYDEASPNVDASKKDIEELTTIIQNEIEFIKQNSELALTELANCITSKSYEYEAFINGIYEEFQALLG